MVDAGRLIEESHDAGEAGRLGRFILLRRRLRVGVPGDARDLAGDRVRGQHEVDAPGGDGAPGHARVLGRVILRERDAAGRLDGFESERAIGRAAREDYADRAVSLILGERLEEDVDRPLLPVGLAGQEPELALSDGHVQTRWNHVDMVRLDEWLVPDLRDRQGGRPG
jgi:hypothetical protein